MKDRERTEKTQDEDEDEDEDELVGLIAVRGRVVFGRSMESLQRGTGGVSREGGHRWITPEPQRVAFAADLGWLAATSFYLFIHLSHRVFLPRLALNDEQALVRDAREQRLLRHLMEAKQGG